MPVIAEDMSVPAAELMIVGHYDKLPGYDTRRPAGSPSWLLMWTQAGAGLVAQGGAPFEARAGDLVVLGSGVGQHYRVAPGASRWRFWWVHFQPRPSWPAWLAPYGRGGGCHVVPRVPGELHERMDMAFGRALRDARWVPPSPSRGMSGPAPPDRSAEQAVIVPAPGHGAEQAVGRGGEPMPAVVMGGPARELVLGAVEEALVLATASARPEGARQSDEGDERVRRVLAIIAAEPGAPHSVASLARAVALSPSRLAHLFTAETGRTPMQAVRQARVRHAAGLLEVTDLDVGQVAAASGFVSPFHFSRAFKREYGLPPRDYRARLRRQP
ncbi:AraC family transcriptional regulator of arabinose operon [Nonomuraea polychroma]|uniref:AraC family transcriptional regulator of arabinose operon n=1 Tax=Nonomuraea polychroma TaxID=46176 RepID=A0A438M9X3_9ACTN|nr:AraC family transcriptional regulator [Nonomuraea polychroma]RVX42519.1 AraC family transcriptional regulator of arabinose operon [Nonomuraea polychroma]